MRRYGSEANDRWLGFEHRPGDIVISTRSKCGTTWVQMACALLVLQTPDLPAPLGEISPWLDWDIEPLADVAERLDRQEHRRIIKTHTPLDGLPLRSDVTYLVVGRHPLDVAVSLYHHGQNIDRARVAELTGRPEQTSPTEPFAGWFPTWMDPAASIDEELDTLPGLAHHLSDAWDRRGEPNVVLLHYRDLADDTEGAMRGMAARLGIEVPEEAWPDLVAAASFEAMRERAEERAPDRLGVLADRQAFFRSGRSGEGTHLVIGEARQAYDEQAGALLAPDLLAWLAR
ncbi:sulfotransferase domain-containing protein [Aquihabitans sp. McL0605]|uniref:sulfotransferase domain-containing protein n=1 Tax=Aquihabitans sp. McL0605 TaxID=3415671 RepID=UPI003CF59FC5